VKRSPELEALARRLSDVLHVDVESRRESWLRDPNVVALGTDPDEFWTGHDEISAILDVQARELMPVEFGTREPKHIAAYEVGPTAGWAVVVFDPYGNVTMSTRISFVFELDGMQWKVVHTHWSLGVPNEDVFPGLPLTTTIEGIADQVGTTRPDVSAAAAGDGTVTLLFSDVENSTLVLANIGDRRYMELLQWHNGVVRDAVAAHSGHEVSWQGDGFVLAFPSARRALRCAFSVQTAIASGPPSSLPPVRVRMGLHTGEALRERDDFYGHVVHYAARVAGSASGGEVLASGVVRQLLTGDDEWTFDERAPREFKGFEGPQIVFAVTRRQEQRS
jgi:class 3 adenylate cyclase